MAGAVSPEVIKRTQETLGQHVRKPPLTEKLLAKPPFRFLHDVFSAAMRDTGVLEGRRGEMC
jgi:TRAF3-interacting protein 1